MMTIRMLAVFLLFAYVHSLYTSSYWLKQGINVRDPHLGYKTETGSLQAPFIQTNCSDVDLSASPHNYSSVVMSGYLNVNKGGSALGFIFYGKDGATKQELLKYPVVIWLNGGPGSSSQLGNFLELGPLFLKSATMQPFEIVRNNYTWVKNYNVLFVDQPVGTGLSYADPTAANVFTTSMDDVAKDFYYALRELYTNQNGCFTKLKVPTSHPLFIFGQSYAGKYVPAIAEKIVREQKQNAGFLTGLKGVAIGDGFTHPFAILSQVGEYAFNMGLIDYQQRSVVQQVILNATSQHRRQAWTDLHDSFDLALDLIVDFAGNVNVYDITKYHQYPDQIIGSYIGNPDIIKLYNLNPQIKFGSQAGQVYQAMYVDFMKDYVQLVQKLLDYDMNVLIYNGQNDLIVQTPGTFKWVQRLHYKDADTFRETLFTPWKIGDRTAGYYKLVGRLQLKTVNNAGHLVPMDQGESALDLVTGFVTRSM